MDQFIRELEKSGELIRVRERVNHQLEMTEIVDRISKSDQGGKAVLFENNGTDFPVLMNALGSEGRITLAFGGRSPETLSREVLELFKVLTGQAGSLVSQLQKLPKLAKIRRWMPVRKKGRGLCQEVIMPNPNLSKLPVLHCWPADGGPFITLPLVHTIDPDTGSRNLGMYRMQVFDKRTTGMHWHMHKTGARHYRAYQKRGERMPVAVALGGDMVYTYSATAPLPDGIDEYLLAGFIRNKPVRLVKCLTQDIWVPEDADFIIEGYVDPAEEKVIEGPFGDHTGFYSLADRYPKFHVTAVTHRVGAVYPATIVGIPPMEDAWIAKATEEIFREPLRLSMIPELVDFHLPVAGVAHNIGLFSIHNDYPGMGRKILSSVWGAGQMMFTKFGLVINEDAVLRNYRELVQDLCQRVRPVRDLLFITGPLDILDHASDQLGLGGKMGIDGTAESDPITMIDADQLAEEIQMLRSQNPDLVDIKAELVDQGILIAAVIFQKAEAGQARRIAREILNYKALSRIKCWVMTDWRINEITWFEWAWLVGRNADPVRDTCVSQPESEEDHPGVLFIDASIKSAYLDGFERDWPNPVVMDQKTIQLVNKKWPQYQLGPFLESPSIRYHAMMRGSGAVSSSN